MKPIKLTFSTLSETIRVIKDLFISNPSSAYRLTITDWKEKRGLSSNAQIHLWFGQIAKRYDGVTALDIKNQCKDMFGLPILLASPNNSEKYEFLLHKLDYYQYSYENKMKLIQCLDVTSVMSTAEIKVFMDQMRFYYNDLGIDIKFKDK